MKQVESRFDDLHIIHGACSMRAQRVGLSIPPAQQPYHRSVAKTPGRLIGIYADGAEYCVPRHGTQTHTHALLKDENGQVFTAHVERVGVRAGSVIRLPALDGTSATHRLVPPPWESVARIPRRRLQTAEVVWDAAGMARHERPLDRGQVKQYISGYY